MAATMVANFNAAPSALPLGALPLCPSRLLPVHVVQNLLAPVCGLA